MLLRTPPGQTTRWLRGTPRCLVSGHALWPNAAPVAVADERGRLTAASPAKNPRHRARAARPLSNGRSP